MANAIPFCIFKASITHFPLFGKHLSAEKATILFVMPENAIRTAWLSIFFIITAVFLA
jgi:hypothetical protein